MGSRNNNARRLHMRAPDQNGLSRQTGENASYPIALDDASLDVGVYRSPGKTAKPRRNNSPVAWFLSEFLLGPLFLVMTHVYTFVFPRSIASTADVRLWAQRIIKRVLDLICSVIGIILVSPLFIILPILIKLDSRGSVFYTQVRIGRNRRKSTRRAYNIAVDESNRRRDRRRDDVLGKPFKVIKFRTMVSDAEKQSGPVWATKGDTRITRIGGLLRKYRLDEVPQLLNVLRGEMSLVGPRPERPVFVKKLVADVPNYRRRLTVKPGITGLAQVENGYDVSVNSVVSKIRTDIRYIDNWSLLADFRILLRTIKVVLAGEGAN